MAFFQNKMSRNGKVRNAIAKLVRMRHNAIIERRKKNREVAAAKKAEAANMNKASNLAAPFSLTVNEIGRNSVAELDCVCPSPSKNTVMPSVAEWSLRGDDESVPQISQPNTIIQSNFPMGRASTAAPSRAPVRFPAADTPTISESHSFDISQLDSHFYSEFMDDCTVDSIADVTVASSKDPGLFTHGLIAMGELFAGAIVPVTPSPKQRSPPSRRPRSYYQRRSIHQEGSDTDESTKANSTSAMDDESPSASLGESCLSNVNIIESSPLEVEMSLGMVTRFEI